MIHIALCDDEKRQRTALKNILLPWLELNSQAYLFYEFSSGESLFEGYQKVRYDLVFLDIEMTGMNGMETARKLRSVDREGILIFVTAYPDFVFQGYEVRAFHYILKPYQEKRILDVTAKALKELKEREQDYFILPQGAGEYRINLSETLYFYSELRKITMVSILEKKTFYGKLDDLEKELPEYFCRIHQRYLVNLNQVAGTGENYVCIGKENLPVSRSHRQNFFVAFAKVMLKEG